MKKLALLFLLPALASAIYDMDTLEVNRWRTPLYNHGIWGLDVTIGSGMAGGAWPYPLHNCYIFGAGAWLGAILPSSPPDTLCTMLYNPNTGGNEAYPTLCRYWREGTGDSRDRIYEYPGDWPPSHSRFPMAPFGNLSDMDMWCAYCDSDPASHESLGRPLGVDIYQTVYGFSDSLAQDFFFLKYEIANCSGDTLRDACFGPVLDPDVGDATDDMADVILDHVFVIGQDTIRVRNLVFAYDYNNYENSSAVWDTGVPGTVALALLAAPDSLGLTAFKRIPLGADPVTDVAQYLTLAGFDWMTGEYRPYDSTDVMPGDKRFVMSSGPFDIAPDSTVTFWYVVIGSPFGESGQTPPHRDTSDLVLRYKWAREYFEQVTGITEQAMNYERGTMNVGPTIVRGVLVLGAAGSRQQTAERTELLDAAGRKIAELHSGANDVSALSPGVYFVRDARAQTQATRKVVIAR
jgi:hypothetical protein